MEHFANYMETTEQRTLAHKIRGWHRDLGFFLIGITLVYALSGIVLVYRDHDFLNRTVQVEKQLPPKLRLHNWARRCACAISR